MTAVARPSAQLELNHIELVYRPGERDLARRVFEVLGCRVLDFGGPFLTAQLSPERRDLVNNVMYASEVLPEQWELEKRLVEVASDPEQGRLSDAIDAYAARLDQDPQRSFHFGLRTDDQPAYEATLERIRELADFDRGDDELAGRVSLVGVYRPGDPGSLVDTMIQAFVHTDVVASGLLAFGQHVELQCHLAVDGAESPHPDRMAEAPSSDMEDDR
ncbi:MAG TPA: hypothetical protein VKG43_02400 [Acidimicrobiales bacterium]|nr:hypothetical protein [Acidimicrobiales bacterium]